MTRFLTVLFSLSLFACSSDPDHKDTSVPDAGGDAPQVETPASNEAFFLSAAAPICERTYGCCKSPADKNAILFYFGVNEAPADVHACKTAVASSLAEYGKLVDSSFRNKRMKFVPEEAAACLATLKGATATCSDMLDDSGVVNWLSCPKAYQPLVAIGGECIVSTECVDSVCRPTGTSGKCQPKGKEGDTCLGNETCADGFTCSQLHENACVTESARTCIAKRAKGAFCCTTDDCAKGSECLSDDGGEAKCSDPLPGKPADPICTGK